jgi:hypothetical protein
LVGSFLDKSVFLHHNFLDKRAKENKKFIYGVLKEGARAKDFELAIQWLIDCGLLLKCFRVTKPYLPLLAYQDHSAFKLFLHDVGLLGAMAGLDVKTIIDGDAIFTEFKGAIAEQYAMQQLLLDSDRYVGYWTNERSISSTSLRELYVPRCQIIAKKHG